MLNIIGRIRNRVNILINIFRINNNFILPKNVQIKEKVRISYKTKFIFDFYSQIYFEGSVNISGGIIYINNSKVTFRESTIINASFHISKSIFSSKEKLTIYNSTIKINNSEVFFGKNVSFQNHYLEMDNNSKLITGDFILFEKFEFKPSLLKVNNGEVFIGSNNRIQANLAVSKGVFKTKKNVFINHGTEIRILEKVEIGNNCFISYDVVIFDNNSHSIFPENRIKEIEKGFPLSTLQTEELLPDRKEIIIGDNVWIGMRCIIMKGVIIGDNGIVAIGTILTKHLPSNNIAYNSSLKFKKI